MSYDTQNPKTGKPGASTGARLRTVLRGHRRALRWMELLCWIMAVAAIGAYALVYLDRTLYQAYEEWAFGQALEQKSANVPAFMAHMLRRGTGGRDSAEPAGAYRQLRPKAKADSKPAPAPMALEPGAPMGRIEISRIGLEAIIVESTTSDALRHAVGHVEGTALPGQDGNVALAGHRDTFFRGLRDIRKDDIIRIETLDGIWEYRVESTQVVEPDDVQVLKTSSSPILTLVTCYPFNYIGAAPRRFIVRARRIGRPGKTVPGTPAALVKPKPSPGS